MPSPSVTYSFSNSTTADATQVNTNFTDLISGMTDGTKDFSISALTLAGAFTANGHCTFGNASSDDVTFTGSLASSIPIKTTNTYNIGSSTLGLASAYFGANSQTVRVLPSASMSATWTFTLPVATSGTANSILLENGSGVTSWATPAAYGAIQASSEVISTGGTGHGSTATKIRQFTTNTVTGSAISCASDTTNGTVYTINSAGVYAITYQDVRTAGQARIGLSLNSAQLTTNIGSLSAATILGIAITDAANEPGNITVIRRFAANDVIRPHGEGLVNETDAVIVKFYITQVIKI